MASETNEVAVARIDRSSEEWRTLLAKLLEDFTRVLQGEAKLLRASVESALETAVVRGLRHMILAVMGLYGVLCLTFATVLFLHNWIEWWQAFAATGLLVSVIVVVTAQAVHRRS